MNNNNRKKLNLYTQGQRWAARVLLVVGLCVSGTGSALAVPKLGTANIGQHVLVWGLLFFGLSSADKPQHPPLRCLSNDNALDRSCVPPSLAASAKEWSRLSRKLSTLEEQVRALEEQVQKLEEEKEQQQTLQEYRYLQDLQKEKQELEEAIEASEDELKILENQRQKLAKTIEGLHKEQAVLENQRQKFEEPNEEYNDFLVGRLSAIAEVSASIAKISGIQAKRQLELMMVEAAIKNLKTTIQELTADLEAVAAEIDQYVVKIQEQTAICSELQNNLG